MVTILLFVLILNSEPVSPQTVQISVNDLFTYYNSDIDKVKSLLIKEMSL